MPVRQQVLLIMTASLVIAGLRVGAAPASERSPDLDLPPVPEITHLVGLPQLFRDGRAHHLALVRREAEKTNLPPDIADAVAQIESGYRAGAVGKAGEVGLMQVRPETAAMLGHGGGLTSLFEPETNVRFGVRYLAQAWRLTNGDLCRTLMKYRAGHGEERMSALSVLYCRRAREHLAAIGSPLGAGTNPPPAAQPNASTAPRGEAQYKHAAEPVALGKRALISDRPGATPATARASTRYTPKRLETELRLAQAEARRRTSSLDDYWEFYEARARVVKESLASSARVSRVSRRRAARD